MCNVKWCGINECWKLWCIHFRYLYYWLFMRGEFFITARNGQGNVFTPVCQQFCSQGGGGVLFCHFVLRQHHPLWTAPSPWTAPPPRTASPPWTAPYPQTAPPPGQHISWNQVHVHVLLGMLKGNSLTPETSYMKNNNHGSDCKLGVETSYVLKWITPILLPLDAPKDEIFLHEKSFVGTY